MSAPPVSVVIVSRGRPRSLSRSLTAVSQLQYDPFEVIVVADPAGIKAAQTHPSAAHLKTVPFDEANISIARNLGIAQAAGELVAFIDDDAVPEPLWLHHLSAPAREPKVCAVGGFVLGRNGISHQWRARGLDAQGDATALELDDVRATVLHPPKGQAIKTEGTNMAVRRQTLIDLGGFDPAFRYFLDETDLNMRLARLGAATALVPLAVVHHGFEGNVVRHANRVPRDLFEIGASWAVFARKHIPPVARDAHWRRQQARERQRLVEHMVRGTLEPRDVGRMMRRLLAGHADGDTRPLVPSKLPRHPVSPFRPFPALRRQSIVIASNPRRIRRDMETATQQVKNGNIVTVVNLSLTALYHTVRFEPEGFWLQRGGVFGRSVRDGPLVRMTTRSRRIEKERQRVASVRGLGDDLRKAGPGKRTDDPKGFDGEHE